MVEYINCNICGSSDFITLYKENIDYRELPSKDNFRCTATGYGRHGRIVKCKCCGFVFVNPRRHNAIVENLYNEQEDSVYYDEKRGRNLTFRKALELLNERHPDKGKLLDVGCGIGLFLRLARSSGWDVLGVEPSRWAAGIANEKYRLKVHQGTLQSANLKEEEFDIVTMWDVIEHCVDPQEELNNINRILKKQGYIYITTMDLGSWIARILGPRWWWFMEMHLHYFTRETIEKLLNKAGFEVTAITRHSRYITLSYLISRVEKFSGGMADKLNKTLKNLRLHKNLLMVNLGDIMTVAAHKKRERRV